MKSCKILGYAECTIKETHEDMIRICISVNSESENYIGEKALYIFLPNTEELLKDLQKYFNNEYTTCNYETSDNIISGRTKVVKLIFS